MDKFRVIITPDAAANIIYVDVENKRVYVMNVIYARSDRLNELLKYE